MIGDLAEEFHKYAKRFSLRYAQLWYYVQVLKLAVHYPLDYTVGMLERVGKWLRTTG